MGQRIEGGREWVRRVALSQGNGSFSSVERGALKARREDVEAVANDWPCVAL